MPQVVAKRKPHKAEEDINSNHNGLLSYDSDGDSEHDQKRNNEGKKQCAKTRDRLTCRRADKVQLGQKY
jgi:hypothetical protein